MPDPTADTGAEPEPEAEESSSEEPAQPFANRAARRAKGKTSSNPAVGTEGRRPMRAGTVQSPRQYGNRRSG